MPEAVPEDTIDLGASEHAATYNAACAIGAVTEVGMIAPGRLADFIICRSDYTAKRVFLGGVEV